MPQDAAHRPDADASRQITRAAEQDASDRRGRGRRVLLPVLLLLATCLSTFWVGAVDWKPLVHLEGLYRGAATVMQNLPQGSPVAALEQGMAVARMDWRQGLFYMAVVLAVLATHEMGHFLMALRYRIPASLPYFIPVPFVPFGTLGAVIGMEGSRANRREMFDLGVAGPLAGLAVTLPIAVLGILALPQQPLQPMPGEMCFHNPLLMQYLIAWLNPDYPTPAVFYLNQFTPLLMAGWLGMLVTGLNMLPISQFDGGHVAHALLGRRARILARGLLIAAIVFIIAEEQYGWVLMLVVVILLGVDHPPTADDGCRLGWPRRLLGAASLLLPVLCFPAFSISV
jgi:Zn-dependent protease